MFLRSHVASPIRRYRPSIHAHELRSSPSKEGEYQLVVHAALVTSSTELHSSNKESLCVECASVRPVPNYTSALSGPSKTLCTLGTQARHFVTCEDGHCSTRWEVVLESRDADIAPSLLPISPTATRGAKRPSSRTNSSCPRPAARPSMPPQTRAAQCLVNVLAQVWYSLPRGTESML